jgi:AcrR family transcriptional regulator
VAVSRIVPPPPALLAGEDVPPAPRQARSIDRRERLNRAALRRFGKQGYAATSLEQIAGDAGMPVGAVYLHYRSKRQLLLSLMNDLLTGLSELSLDLPVREDPREALDQLLRRGFEQDLRYLGAYRAWREAVLSDPDLARKQALIQRWTTARVAGVFRRLRLLPRARRDIDVEETARLLDSVLWDLLSQAARRRDPNLDRTVDATVRLIYHTLFFDE